MMYLIAFIRFILIATIIFSFFIVNGVVSLILFRSEFLRRKLATKYSALCAGLILKILNFKITVEGDLKKGPYLLIGNHMSYLDILIYLSFFETFFVTSVDMRERLFLGQITILGGCLYVERRNPRKLPQEMRQLKTFFDRDFKVCIFPEGTSSDGRSVLKFKNSLFQIATENKIPVQPIALNYLKVNGLDFGDQNRDKVCWYGEMGFFPHFFGLLQLKSVEAKLCLLPTIDASKFESRKELADNTYATILDHYETNKP